MEVFDCKVEQIKVGERFRKFFPNNDTLKKSIQDKGIISPLIIDEGYNLVAGERRLTCAKELGLATVPVYFRKQADELTCREIELEENICREDFTDEERVKAVLEIHRLKQAKYGTSYAGSKEKPWTLSDTANSLGISKTLASVLTQVGEFVETKQDVDVSKALKSSVHDAYKLILKKKADEVAAVMAKNIIESQSKTVSEEDAYQQAKEMILLGDSCELIKTLPSESIDFGFTDSPYGIDIQELRKEAKEDVYAEDSAAQFDKMWEVLSKEYYRVLRKDAFLFVFCGFQTKDVLDKHLRSAGFEVSPVPFFWVRTGGQWQCNTPTKWPASAVEIATIAVKGQPIMVQQGLPNFNLAPVISNQDKIHGLEKPQELIRDILTRYCISGMTILDTFGGSGSTVIAARSLAMKAIAFEKSEQYFNRAFLRLVDNIMNVTYSESEQVEEQASEQLLDESDEKLDDAFAEFTGEDNE